MLTVAPALAKTDKHYVRIITQTLSIVSKKSDHHNHHQLDERMDFRRTHASGPTGAPCGGGKDKYFPAAQNRLHAHVVVQTDPGGLPVGSSEFHAGCSPLLERRGFDAVSTSSPITDVFHGLSSGLQVYLFAKVLFYTRSEFLCSFAHDEQPKGRRFNNSAVRFGRRATEVEGLSIDPALLNWTTIVTTKPAKGRNERRGSSLLSMKLFFTARI